MSFVGTRPEVEKYVDQYSEEMMATLFLPAGITSYASIMYKDEDERIGAYQKQTGKYCHENRRLSGGGKTDDQYVYESGISKESGAGRIWDQY